jgi:SAM-dependent methyltransferase
MSLSPARVLRGLRRLPRLVRHLGQHRQGTCTVCGQHSVFLALGPNLKESLACLHCGAWLRLRFLAQELVRLHGDGGSRSLRDLVQRPDFRSRRIWEAQASGPLHAELSGLPGHIGSEYLSGVERGSSRDGVHCEDMQRLTFADESLDLVLHSSVLEHVREPLVALRECARVLAPGGHLVFEVPMTDPGAPEIRTRTVRRVDTRGPEDVLVYTDFGLDLRADLEGMGLDVDVRSQEIPGSTMRHAVVWVCRKR